MLKTVLLIIEAVIIVFAVIISFFLHKTIKMNEDKTVDSISEKLNKYLNIFQLLTVALLIIGCVIVFLK